jgi:hypothetical protein
VSDPVFHVELRQFPNVARAFNLSREELESRFAAPWRAGRAVELDDRRWSRDKAKLAVYEGRRLGPEELGLGRGWANATRTAQEVTARVLEARSAVDALKAALPDRIALSELVGLAGAQYPGARVSEHLALVEQAVWQLLHEGQARLVRAGRPLAREQWAAVLLSWEAWRDPELWLESGVDLHATTSAISRSRSEREANR